MAKTIYISSKLLLLHAHDLLDQNIIEKGGFEPQYERCDLPSTIKHVVKLVRSTLMKKPIAIQFDVSKCLKYKHRLLCDHRRLQQVLLNLLTNAVKFQTEGNILVTAEVKNQMSEDSEDASKLMAVISVRDQGIGMTEEEAKYIFEPFYRGKS